MQQRILTVRATIPGATGARLVHTQIEVPLPESLEEAIKVEGAAQVFAAYLAGRERVARKLTYRALVQTARAPAAPARPNSEFIPLQSRPALTRGTAPRGRRADGTFLPKRAPRPVSARAESFGSTHAHGPHTHNGSGLSAVTGAPGPE